MTSTPAAAAPRIRPGQRSDIGAINDLVARILGIAAGTQPPNLFTTLGRHRRLFRPWLRFASRLMPGGVLPRQDAELVILRVASLTGSSYERLHHERLGRDAGLTIQQVERTAAPELLDGDWQPRQAALLAAVDELHARQQVSEAVWRRLEQQLSETELIELPMLVGHYEMLAMLLNTLRVQPDQTASASSPIHRLINQVARRHTTPARKAHQ